jgi:F-type H+-transporting ATPase subunit delta
MIPSSLAERYAKALFATALHKDLAGEVQDNIENFSRLLEINKELKKFMSSPQVRNEDKQEFLEKNLGDILSPTFIGFLKLLLDKNRFEFLQEISIAYTDLHEKHLGILRVSAVTAVPLDSALEKKVIEKLERETKKKIKLSKSVDPDIIGGMIIIMENQIIDGSIRFQLDKLRTNLKEVKVY